MLDVLVTRPIESGRRTADRLSARGHRAILAPMLSIQPVKGMPPPGPYDAAIVTSASVAIAAERLDAFRTMRTFAVGQQCGLALQEIGFTDVIAGDGDAADLAGLIIMSMPRGSRLLVIAGRDRKDDMDAALSLAGHRLAIWTVYAAEPATDLTAAVVNRINTGQIDAVLHYSARSARTFATVARRNGLIPALGLIPQICLSPDVAEPLREAGIHRIGVADRPDERSLLDELERFCR